ncbi:hypothetical protein JY651_50350 [Pyxidicoccus parkwayensis]|uniref:Uncharacterized protein n=1 Tax=Pyxidicoccus parkwayensis TaxID=2813578 RepID=A0ABX7NWN2_9BACT|nr:hypothetical protein [Pyxidicoccus parkwaysis]QSQ23195.1 hypothetical protein JY651_50350 [Pyxidicoccus parkwaysis]
MVLGEIPKAGAREFDYPVKTDCPESRRSVSMTLLETGDSTKVRFQERYSGLAKCSFNSDTYVVRPEADCEASLLLNYQLVEVCEAPCHIEMRQFLPPAPPKKTEFYCDCG